MCLMIAALTACFLPDSLAIADYGVHFERAVLYQDFIPEPPKDTVKSPAPTSSDQTYRLKPNPLKEEKRIKLSVNSDELSLGLIRANSSTLLKHDWHPDLSVGQYRRICACVSFTLDF